MDKEKTLQLLLVEGEQEELVKIVEQVRYPNSLGKITPPVTVTHNDKEYVLHRHYADVIYIYKPAKKVNIDVLLD